MKIIRNFLLGLAGGLLLTAVALGDDAALPGNPYAPVVARNIFGLNPPPPVDPNAAADATPPPKITPNGIMSIFGQLQVLFKVANPAKAGKPAADDDYILSEGQRQDDIEVVKIDEKAGVVTFNNHGQTQELALVAATPSSTPAPGGGNPGNPPPPPPPGFRPPPGGLTRPIGNTFNGGGVSSTGNYGGNRGNNPGNGGINPGGGTGGGLNFGYPSSGNSAFHNAAAQIPEGVTAETQPILIEANRAVAEDPSIYPITELTPQNQQ